MASRMMTLGKVRFMFSVCTIHVYVLHPMLLLGLQGTGRVVGVAMPSYWRTHTSPHELPASYRRYAVNDVIRPDSSTIQHCRA